MNWAWYLFYGHQLNMNEKEVKSTAYGMMCDLISCFSIFNGVSEQKEKDAGAYVSNCYLGFLQTPSMPDYDIKFDYSGYYTASSQIVGCSINNSEYTMRLYDAGEIQDGDFLKVTVEFYNNNNLVGSLDKYLVDYVSTRELQIVKEWEDWEMAKEMQDKKITMGSFDAVKFRVETSGGKFVPCFCLDNFMIQLSVEF